MINHRLLNLTCNNFTSLTNNKNTKVLHKPANFSIYLSKTETKIHKTLKLKSSQSKCIKKCRESKWSWEASNSQKPQRNALKQRASHASMFSSASSSWGSSWTWTLARCTGPTQILLNIKRYECKTINIIEGLRESCSKSKTLDKFLTWYENNKHNYL